jgi:hypothetical protein
MFTIVATLALALVLANFIVAESNRATQIEVNERQQFINQGIELSRLNQTLVRFIAVAAVKNDDAKLKEILTEQGITVTLNPSAPLVSPATATGVPASAVAQKDYP